MKEIIHNVTFNGNTGSVEVDKDAEIKEGDWFVHTGLIMQASKGWIDFKYQYTHKIISASKSLGLPVPILEGTTIESDEMTKAGMAISEKSLSKDWNDEAKAQTGVSEHDIHMMAYNEAHGQSTFDYSPVNNFANGFKKGFKSALPQQFSREQMIGLLEWMLKNQVKQILTMDGRFWETFEGKKLSSSELLTLFIKENEK